MSRISSIKDGKGGMGIDWIVLGAGLLLLGVMLIQDVYLGAMLDTAPMNGPAAAAPAVTMDADRAPASRDG